MRIASIIQIINLEKNNQFHNITGKICNAYGIKEIQLLPQLFKYEYWLDSQSSPNLQIREISEAKEIIKEIKWNGVNIEATDLKDWNKYLIDQQKENILEITPKLGQTIVFKVIPKIAPAVSIERDNLN